MEVKVLDPRVHTWGLPQRHSAYAAALDLYACIDESLTLLPQSPAVLVPSGLAIHIDDPNVAALVVPRSGLGHRDGLILGNSVGVIDADYTGPLMISLWNRNAPGTTPVVIAPGDRIAQLLFVPVMHPQFSVVDEFSCRTVRGAGGFGSTGQAVKT
jgi:dUTP pyrophosphatase